MGTPIVSSPVIGRNGCSKGESEDERVTEHFRGMWQSFEEMVSCRDEGSVQDLPSCLGSEGRGGVVVS